MSDIFVFSRLKRDSNGNLCYCSVPKGLSKAGSFDNDDMLPIINPKVIRQYFKRMGINMNKNSISVIANSDDGIESVFPYIADDYCDIINLSKGILPAVDLIMTEALYCVSSRFEREGVDWVRFITFKEEADGRVSLKFFAYIAEYDMFLFIECLLNREIFVNSNHAFIWDSKYILNKEVYVTAPGEGKRTVIDVDIVGSDKFTNVIEKVCRLINGMIRGFEGKYGNINRLYDVVVYLNSVSAELKGFSVGRLGYTFGYDSKMNTLDSYMVYGSGDQYKGTLKGSASDERFFITSHGMGSTQFSVAEGISPVLSGIRLVAGL